MAVPGEGHPSTEVLFVGEAPGLNEDRQGRPFVGAAGRFLDELLGSIGWSRDEVFITNVVKCRPPQNRDPKPDEIAACAPYLGRQLEVLEPRLVVTLGRHSMGRFLPGTRIGQVHGTVHRAPEGTPAPGAQVFAMYHPAAALHQGSLKATLLDDMAQVPGALLDARAQRARMEAPAQVPEASSDADLRTGAPGSSVGIEPEAIDPGVGATIPEPASEPGHPVGQQPGPAASTPGTDEAAPDAAAVRAVGVDADDDQTAMFQ